jgi:hypothetical protein
VRGKIDPPGLPAAAEGSQAPASIAARMAPRMVGDNELARPQILSYFARVAPYLAKQFLPVSVNLVKNSN